MGDAGKVLLFIVIVALVCVGIHQKDNIGSFFDKMFSNSCSIGFSFAQTLLNNDNCCSYVYEKICNKNEIQPFNEIRCMKYIQDKEYLEKKCFTVQD